MREGGLVLGPYLRWEKDIIINPSPPAGKNQDLMNSNMTNDTLSEKLLCSTFSIDPQKNGKLAQMDCKKGFVKKIVTKMINYTTCWKALQICKKKFGKI